MKKGFALLLVAAMLLPGCTANSEESGENTVSETIVMPETTAAPTVPEETGPVLTGEETAIVLSDDGVTVNGEAAGTEGPVYLSTDIIYYEDLETYESGNPYGEGGEADRHSAEEAAAHTVVNITEPGIYRVSGLLSQGQLRVDLGENAAEDPEAVVYLILDNADITCTVAPAILFLNVYECDGDWSAETAQAEVDTTAAGANLILAEGSQNRVNGSYVAKIFKDNEEEKKLWKQDGAIYSYMSMNIYGPGSLDLYAENEGVDTERHLTIYGGNLNIRSGNDGINTNEDGVSVTTINGGNLHIIAGLGDEGDGIDSNGYLVINGGTVVSSANPAADAGLDSDMGSYVNGGTVIALGSTMDWAESDSQQVTMNLQFAQYQSSGSAIVITDANGNYVFAYDPSEDEVLGENVRQYMGAVISSPNFAVGESYQVYLDGTLTGTDEGGVFDVATITDYADGIRQAYTGTDVGMGMGGFGGGMGGQRPDSGFPSGETFPQGEAPEDMTMPTDMEFPGGDVPEGEVPGDMSIPEGEMPSGMTFPEGEAPEMPTGQEPDGNGGRPGGFGGQGGQQPGGVGQTGVTNTLFYMQDQVNSFSGVTAATETENT